MKSKLVVFCLLTLIISGCAGSEEPAAKENLASQVEQLSSQLAALKSENEKLKSELDEIKNGAERLLAEATKYYENKDLAGLNKVLELMNEKHPDAEESKSISELSSKLTDTINKEKEAAEKEAAALEEAKKKRLAEATSKMRKEYDEVEEITWYHDKTSPQYINTNSFNIFIGQKDGAAPYLVMSIQYTGDSWVFIDRYTFKVDDESYNITPSYGEVKRDNNATVWEYYRTLVKKNEYELIKAVINSKKTIIRHQGSDHQHDRVVSSAEKKALENVLDAYEALGGMESAF